MGLYVSTVAASLNRVAACSARFQEQLCYSVDFYTVSFTFDGHAPFLSRLMLPSQLCHNL